MIAVGQQRKRLPTFTRALLSLATLVALWQFRPGLPSLPRSFSGPLTIETIEGLTVWFLWLVVALLALALLFTPRRPRARRPVATIPRSRDTSSWLAVRARRARFQPPSLVILSPDRAPPASANGRAAAPEQPASVGLSPSARDVIAQPTRPQVSVLGPLTITGTKRSRRGLRARAFELIAYLALHSRPVQRDELLEAFWPGLDPRRTRPRLRQAVRDARRLLGSVIVGEHECYWLDRAGADVDLDELERLLAAANTAEPEHAQVLTEGALRLFRGEPLAGADYAWSESGVRRLRATFVDLLEQVARHRLEAGEVRTALDAAERAIAIDSLNEDYWRLALKAEGELGAREAVEERYERLRALLNDRLGLEPSKETRTLYLQLLAQG